MPSKLALGLIVSISLGLLAKDAGAGPIVIYTSNYPPTGPGAEINGSLGPNTSRSFMASGMMGVAFFENKSVAGMEASLLSICQSKTKPTSTWPETCDFGAMISTLNSTFAEHWIHIVYNDTSQSDAISLQISGLRDYHSPSLAPLYGQADHWGTAYEVGIDASSADLKYVKLFDGGPSPLSDGGLNSYADGVVQSSGATWKSLFFRVVTSIAGTDPYYNKFLVTFDPPASTDPRHTIEAPGKHGVSASPGVLHDGERMSAELAQERAWNAIFAAQVNEDDGLWSSIEKSIPDLGWAVSGVKPSGEAWDYYLVPMRDESESVVAIVQMSADDGALEQIWVGSRPIPFLGVTRAEAIALAGELLADDEMLEGGELTWNPQAAGPHARSPLFPYYEFRVDDSQGHPRREVVVTLQGGVAHEVKPSSLTTALQPR